MLLHISHSTKYNKLIAWIYARKIAERARWMGIKHKVDKQLKPFFSSLLILQMFFFPPLFGESTWSNAGLLWLLSTSNDVAVEQMCIVFKCRLDILMMSDNSPVAVSSGHPGKILMENHWVEFG